MWHLSMITFWIAAAVIFLVIEGVTFTLASIWFAFGSVAALIVASLGGPVWLQLVWFFIVSIVTLLATRPLAMKYVNSKRQPTNADMLIGKTAVVTEEIDNLSATGAVSINSKIWTARSDAGSIIKEGELVAILRIEGVKLIVTSLDGAAEAMPEQ